MWRAGRRTGVSSKGVLSPGSLSFEYLTVWWQNKTGGQAVATECDRVIMGQAFREGVRPSPSLGRSRRLPGGSDVYAEF